MTTQALLTLAATHIDASEHAFGDFGHYFSYMEGNGSQTVYLVNDEDMLDLGERLNSGERRAYSFWCTSSDATEITRLDLDTAYPGRSDWAAITSEATAAGQVEVLACLAHLV